MQDIKVSISLRVDPLLRKFLDKRSAKLQTSKSAIVNHILKTEFIEKGLINGKGE